MCAMRRPAKSRCATSSRFSPISNSAASPSATTATSPIPTSCARQLVRRGSLFQSTSDTEVIIHLIATSLKHSVEERMIDALHQVEGAYSLVALSAEGLDRACAIRWACGRWSSASSAMPGSSRPRRCALDIIGADFVRDIDAGEMIVAGPAGLRSIRPFDRAKKRVLHFRIYLLRAARQRRRRHQRLRDAQAHRRRAGAREPCRRRTSSSRCRIRACRRRSAMPARQSFLSSSASSAITMSAAPSSSRPTRSAISA